ncbi:MAG: hypothetical protein NTV86_03700 [Planctomycetota bacterium]|nr:hypothetical protein [Planctomycetota bacterium]
MGFLVWPTPYRFDHITERGSVYPVRINRFSGKTEILNNEGWAVVRALREREDAEPLPSSEVAKIVVAQDGCVELDEKKEMTLTVYNGSDWAVREVQVEITVQERPPPPTPPKQANQSSADPIDMLTEQDLAPPQKYPNKVLEPGQPIVLQRTYTLLPQDGRSMLPYQTGQFRANLGIHAWGSWVFRITGARGTK